MSILARVRGIYTTAITKILRDEGIGITQPTEPIIERFKIKNPIFLPPSVTIKDRDDKKGIVIIGEPKATDKIVSILESKLSHLILKEFKPNLYSIYKGRVVDFKNNTALVDIGEIKGRLLPEHSIRVRPGEEVLVCVLKPSLKGEPLLSLNPVITGKYMRFTKGARISFSKFIDMKKREELLEITSLLKINGWGIRWRSSANYADIESILSDYESIKKSIKKIKESMNKLDAPSLLYEGEKIVEVVLPLESKEKLDEIRRYVVPTAPHHHHIKSIVHRKLQGVIEFVEYTVEKSPTILNNISSLCLSFFLKEILGRKKSVEIIQENVDKGEIIIRGTIQEIDYDKNIVVVKRSIKGRGVYDGLGIKKEIGDYAVTYVQLYRPYILHAYYSSSSMLKGIYININTPVEMHSEGRLWCVDLKVDVVCTYNRGAKIIDMNELNELVKKGTISEAFSHKVLSLAEHLKEILDSAEGIDKIVDIIFKNKK